MNRSDTSQAPASRPAPAAPDADRRSRRAAALATMCAGMFLVQLDVTVVNVALPHIGTAMHTGLSGLQWVVDSYAVVLAALLLTAGVAGDRFGHRVTVLTGLVLFGVASLGCSAAPGIGVLIGFRALQGVAAAILLPGTLAVVSKTFPERAEHARALGIWAGVSALALPTGPVLGGALVTALGWRTVFWINLPVVTIAFVATIRLLAEDHGNPAAQLDLFGMVTAALALGALVFTVIEAGSSITTVVAGSVITVVSAVAFVVRERTAQAPMIPPSLMRYPPFAGTNAVAAAMNFVGIGAIFVLTLYLQEIRGHSAITAGAMMLPLFAPLAVMAPVTGRIGARTGPRLPMLAGLALGTAGGAALLLVTVRGPYPELLPSLLGLGLGMGLLTPSVVTAAMRTCSPERQGLASGTNNTARQAAGAVGVAVFGAIAASPAHPGSFVSGLHAIAILSAALWLASIVITLRVVQPNRPAASGRPAPAFM